MTFAQHEVSNISSYAPRLWISWTIARANAEFRWFWSSNLKHWWALSVRAGLPSACQSCHPVNIQLRPRRYPTNPLAHSWIAIARKRYPNEYRWRHFRSLDGRMRPIEGPLWLGHCARSAPFRFQRNSSHIFSPNYSHHHPNAMKYFDSTLESIYSYFMTAVTNTRWLELPSFLSPRVRARIKVSRTLQRLLDVKGGPTDTIARTWQFLVQWDAFLKLGKWSRRVLTYPESLGSFCLVTMS